MENLFKDTNYNKKSLKIKKKTTYKTRDSIENKIIWVYCVAEPAGHAKLHPEGNLEN